MKNIFLFHLLFIFIKTSVGQTYVNGFISANTTWNLVGSPYIVNGNALLSNGNTLTIEPGVIVKFDNDKALQIDGKLIAVGTPLNRIIFTSNQAVPSAGDWGKIHFPDLCEDAVLDAQGNYLSGSIMKYCDVRYGGGLGFGEIHIEASTPYFSECRITQSSSSGFYSGTGDFSIDSSLISDCQDYGIYYLSYSLTSHDIFFRNDSILNNINGGIFLGSGGGSDPYYFRINKCTFLNNLNDGAISAPNYSHRNLLIEENHFESNENAITGTGFEKTSISCNHFIANTENVINLSNYSSSGSISHNIFNANSGTLSMIQIQNTQATLFIGRTYITDNVLTNNSYASCCLRYHPRMDNDQLIQIMNNNFENNNTPKIISIDNSNAPPGTYDFIKMKYNSFSNPLAQYELHNNIPYGSSNMTVDSNYWGTTVTAHIDSVIYDYFDFANQSVVYYQPILNSPIEANTNCIPFGSNVNENRNRLVLSSAFPNPFPESTTIRFAIGLQDATFMLFNSLGQNVKTENYKLVTEIHFSRKNLPDGIYFYSVIEQNGLMSSGKLIIR